MSGDANHTNDERSIVYRMELGDGRRLNDVWLENVAIEIEESLGSLSDEVPDGISVTAVPDSNILEFDLIVPDVEDVEIYNILTRVNRIVTQKTGFSGGAPAPDSAPAPERPALTIDALWARQMPVDHETDELIPA